MLSFELNAFHLDEQPYKADIRCMFQTVDQAKAVVADMPKGIKAKTVKLSGKPGYAAIVSVNVIFTTDRVNGGVNETGIKRYRQFVKWCDKQGHTIDFAANAKNSYASRSDFEQAIGV